MENTSMEPETPSTTKMPRKVRTGARRPRLGLALGGGAARGWAHLGVLQALEEAGIRPDFIAGTSIGSLVGAAWASGGLADLRTAVEALDRRTLMTFLNVALPASGRMDGRFLEAVIGRSIRVRDFADLDVPLAAVATDLSIGQEVVLREGDLLQAVRASCGVPGMFRPVRRNGRFLIDGGLVNPVPVTVARDMGADRVIAVDITHHIVEDGPYLVRVDDTEEPVAEAERPLPAWAAKFLPAAGLPFRKRTSSIPATPNLREVLLSAVAISEVTLSDLRLRADPPDLLIRPRVGHIPFLDFTRGREAIAAGYDATREALAHWEFGQGSFGNAAPARPASA
jgi:NTE family protein